jgi:hypothetical protein
MASSIGIRIYQVSVQRIGKRGLLPFDTEGLTTPPPQFLVDFAASYVTATEHADIERTWYFEPKEAKGSESSKGYVHYGTFGFESDFVDPKTKTQNYRRKTSDVEIIPLFYEFWHPKGASHAFAAFQSFHGRSCISLVMNEMQRLFAEQNQGVSLIFKKLLPVDASGGIYQTAPVKSLRLINRSASGDIADRYLSSRPEKPITFEITMSAKRKDILGLLGPLTASLKGGAGGVVTHDGISFPEAIAEIQVGGRKRRVGVLGSNGDAGVIDLSDSIKRGADGHPTFASIAKESGELLKEFHATLSGKSL